MLYTENLEDFIESAGKSRDWETKIFCKENKDHVDWVEKQDISFTQYVPFFLPKKKRRNVYVFGEM